MWAKTDFIFIKNKWNIQWKFLCFFKVDIAWRDYKTCLSNPCNEIYKKTAMPIVKYNYANSGKDTQLFKESAYLRIFIVWATSWQ